MSAARTLSERACALPPVERLQLVDEILGSLDETSLAIDRLWVRDAETAWPRGGVAKSATCRSMMCGAGTVVDERAPARNRAGRTGRCVEKGTPPETPVAVG